MEAVLRRILIIVAVAILLTLLLFPVVKGENDLKIEDKNDPTFVASRIETIYFGPEDISVPTDGRPDIYEGYQDDMVFIYYIYGIPLGGGENITLRETVVWLNISIGPYLNSTISKTDDQGMVFFHFTNRWTDTETGNTFSIYPYEVCSDLTVTLEVPGGEKHSYTANTRFCTYHRGWIIDDDDDDRDRCFPLQLPLLIIFLMLVFALFDVFVLIFVSLNELFELHERNERRRRERARALPRFNIVSLPSGSCHEGPSSHHP